MWTTTRMNDMTNEHFVSMVDIKPDIKNDMSNPSTHDETNDEDLLGKYLAVLYDRQPFLGVVVYTDKSDLEAKCPHKIGKNKPIGQIF